MGGQAADVTASTELNLAIQLPIGDSGLIISPVTDRCSHVPRSSPTNSSP
jgi:hypothetical protein